MYNRVTPAIEAQLPKKGEIKILYNQSSIEPTYRQTDEIQDIAVHLKQSHLGDDWTYSLKKHAKKRNVGVNLITVIDDNYNSEFATGLVVICYYKTVIYQDSDDETGEQVVDFVRYELLQHYVIPTSNIGFISLLYKQKPAQ